MKKRALCRGVETIHGSLSVPRFSEAFTGQLPERSCNSTTSIYSSGEVRLLGIICCSEQQQVPCLPAPKAMESRSSSSAASWPWLSTSVGRESCPRCCKRKHEFSGQNLSSPSSPSSIIQLGDGCVAIQKRSKLCPSFLCEKFWSSNHPCSDAR